MKNLKPMGAVAALYAADQQELAESIVASLSHAIFHEPEIEPAGRRKRLIGRLAHNVVRWTTKSGSRQDETGADVTHFTNPLFERSNHPYAKALLTPSVRESSALVEGGDPMNGPYMMLSPEIRKNGGLWDRIFFDSVQSKDVRIRFIHETQATYQVARRALERGESVRIKAVAAGTGLSLILVYDKLIRDGFDPSSIFALITDRDASNTTKSNRLLDKLASTRLNCFVMGNDHGIAAVTEDVFSEPSGIAAPAPFDIVTAIGILEYFQGTSHGSTEKRLRVHEPTEELAAAHLVERLAGMTAEGGSLIINTYRDHSCIRILELFGKRFDFRDRVHLRELLAPMHFKSSCLVGSGHIYDVEIFEKSIPAAFSSI